MKVATVTLTWNRLDALKRCIASIRPGGIDQIIVVDNHTTDGTASWLAEQQDIYTVRLPENRGVVARNYGFDIVRRDIQVVVQIDDDVVVHRGWKETLLASLAPADVVAAGQDAGFVGDFTSLLPSPVPRGAFVDTLTGFCWAIAKHRLSEREWSHCRYDENYGMRWFEEADLQCWLRHTTGMKLVAAPPVAAHCSLAGPVDWDLHNANLARLRDKWHGYVLSEQK